MVKQNLEGITETLLIPLWARAREFQEEKPIIKDEMAREMMEHIDYNFQIFENKKMPQVSIAIRTELLDKATSDFIKRHPDGAVVNIGCGLDTRYYRLDNSNFYWYDLDLPEPIRIRKHFFKGTEHYKMIKSSVFDEEWTDLIRNGNPVMIIAEGLLMYFKECQVRELLDLLTLAFPGGEMLCEVTTSLLVERHKNMKSQHNRNVPFQWGISDGKEMENLNPRIRFIEEWNYFDFHKDRRKKAKISLNRNQSGRIVHLKFAVLNDSFRI